MCLLFSAKPTEKTYHWRLALHNATKLHGQYMWDKTRMQRSEHDASNDWMRSHITASAQPTKLYCSGLIFWRSAWRDTDMAASDEMRNCHWQRS